MQAARGSRRRAWLAPYRSALAKRDARLLFGGLLISATGSWAYNVALLAFVYDQTHSLGWVGAAGLARFVPQLVLSVYGGVIAERTERIRLMVRSDLLCALWQIGLALTAAVTGPPALALVFAAQKSITAEVYQPATAATIPSIVDEDDLVAANALNGMIDQLVVIAGPAVGAILLLVGSAPMVFAVNAASFALSALIVSRIRTRSQSVDVTEGGRAGPLRQMTVGVRAIMGMPAARTLVAYCGLVSFLYGTDTVLFVGVSEHRLGTGPEGFGYLLAGLGVGVIILAGALGYSLPTALLAVIHAPGLAFLVQVFRGGATLVVDVLAITALQRAVAPDQLARVFGVFWAFVLAAITLGTLLAPAVVSVLGLNGGLLVMALAPAALAVAGYPALRAIDRETATRALELEPKVALLEQLEIFAKARRPILERLAAAATEVRFTPASTIIREGDAADALYVLADGDVQVSVSSEGAEHTLAELAAPNYFGELGVLEGIPRTATITALTECRCEQIDGATLLEALVTSPPSSSLMETAQGRLTATQPARALTFGSVQEGVAEEAAPIG